MAARNHQALLFVILIGVLGLGLGVDSASASPGPHLGLGTLTFQSADATAGAFGGTSPPDFGSIFSTFGTLLKWFLILSLLGFILFVVVAGVLLWKAKQLVANAIKSDMKALGRRIERMRRKHPDLDDRALSKKIILRQANRAGLVGFFTGLGGLPTLPITLPIDIALTLRIKADMVHMVRMIHQVSEDDVPEAGLWLASTGGVELASAGSKALNQMMTKVITGSLLKFLPVIGGIIGFGLNWISAQTMGRLSLEWLSKSSAENQTIDSATDSPQEPGRSDFEAETHDETAAGSTAST